MAMTNPLDGDKPITDRNRNLVHDGRFEQVNEKFRKTADSTSEIALPRVGGESWSSFWKSSGTAAESVELIGRYWFTAVDATATYQIGWPRDETNEKVPYAVNLNGVVHYGEITQRINIRKAGKLNLNFLAVRNNLNVCGRGDSQYDVVLKSTSGGQNRTLTFQDKARGLHPTDGTRWVRHSRNFDITEPGEYDLVLEGMRNDPSNATCGSFLTDIFLGYWPVPRVRSVEGAEGVDLSHKVVKVHVGQKVGRLTFMLLDESPVGDSNTRLLNNYEVTLEIRDAEDSGAHFSSGSKTSHIGHTDNEGYLYIPAGLINSGTKASEDGKLVVVVDGQDIYSLPLKVGPPVAVQGEAATVAKNHSAYHSGNRQSAPSHSRFTRALRVEVWDKYSQKATKGAVIFHVVDANGTSGFLTLNKQDSWSSVSGAGKKDCEVSVDSDGQAIAWLWAERSGDGVGTLTVNVTVKGHPSSNVSFLENVWRDAEQLVLRTKDGDGQFVHVGEPFKTLRAELIQRAGQAPVIGEWVRWSIESPAALTFVIPANGKYERETERAVWTQTDNQGVATAPPLRWQGTEDVAGHVTVSCPVAASAEFVLQLRQAIAYVLTMIDNDGMMPLNKEIIRTLKLVDSKTGQGVPNASLEWTIDPHNDQAGVKITPIDRKTNSNGEFRVGVRAKHEGLSIVHFSTPRAPQTTVNFIASPHLVTEYLSLTTSTKLMLRANGKRENNPIALTLDPPNDSYPSVAFDVSPKYDDGLRVVDATGQEGFDGTLPLLHGRAHVDGLTLGDSEQAKSYFVKFSIPGHLHSIRPVICEVNTVGKIYIQLFPENTSSTHPHKVGAGSVVRNDPNIRVIAYDDSQKSQPAIGRTLNFVLTITSPAEARDSNDVVFADGSGISAHATTDGIGQCYVPAMRLQAGYFGEFNVAVFDDAHHRLDALYFVGQAPQPPARIDFENTRTSVHVKQSYEDGVFGSVKVYTDGAGKNPLGSGEVEFSIESTNAAGESKGSTFRGPGGNFGTATAPILKKTMPLDSSGEASIPAILTGSRGKLTLVAVMNGVTKKTTIAVQ